MSSRGTVKDLADKLEAARKNADELDDQVADLETAITGMDAKRAEAIDDRTAFAQLGREIDSRRSEIERLILVRSRGDQEVEQIERDLRHACYQAAAAEANAKSKACVTASELVADLVAKLVAACDALDGARSKWENALERAHRLEVPGEASALLAFDEAEPNGLRDLIDFLAAERDQHARLHEVRHGRDQSERRAVALARAEKRAEAIVEKAYADADGGRPQFNELVGGEGIDVRNAVQRLVHERERTTRTGQPQRQREPIATG
jgi:chromosome segregation ATPase